MELNVLTPGEAVYWSARSVLAAGRTVHTRGMETMEVQNFTVHIAAPWLLDSIFSLQGRNARHFIAAVEALQLIGQVANPELTVAGSPPMDKYRDSGIFMGAYGARVYSQLSRAEDLLLNDSGTRQAVVSIYDGQRDLGAGHKDIPCTLSIQFLWEDGCRLGARTSMRSNDAWLGLPYDLFQFISLQTAMASALGVDIGTYTHTVGSMHLYAGDYEKAQALIASPQPESHTLFQPEPMWSGGSVATISSRARGILAGTPFNDATEFEAMLMSAIGVAL